MLEFSGKIMNLSDWKSLDYSWMKEWWNVGKFSGIDSFVRNLFYMLFIVRMMNVVEEQGTYWVSNGFIWGGFTILNSYHHSSHSLIY